MKKYFGAFSLLVISITLISWGSMGHRTVATIAYNHLTPKAKAAVKALLGDQSMADVASWADEVLRQPEYKHTASWHYVNISLGLSYNDFSKEVTGQSQENVYSALIANEKILSSTTNTNEQKAEALKFIIHFVGDLHQPMHVSRKEDKGGNTIQLQYEGKSTNLHSLWDSKLIGTEGKNFEQMSNDYDKATPQQINQWQSDEPMKWLFESYQISNKLYPEIEQNNKLSDDYIKSHINIVHERIEMAGIRLAGVLNNIFENQTITPSNTTKPPVVKELPGSQAVSGVKLEDVSKHIGERVAVQGIVADYKKFSNMVLVNLGAPYPNQQLTLVFKGEAIQLSEPVIKLKGSRILVIGNVVEFKGKPQIEITGTNQLFNPE